MEGASACMRRSNLSPDLQMVTTSILDSEDRCMACDKNDGMLCIFTVYMYIK